MQFHYSVDLYEQDSELSLRGRLRELNNKGKVHLGIPKSGRSHLREWSLELVRSLNIRDFKIQWRRRRRERQKDNSFYKKNNNFARASRFFVHFFARFCTTTTWKCLISRFMECVNKQRRNFISLSELGYGPSEFNSRRVRLHLTK